MKMLLALANVVFVLMACGGDLEQSSVQDRLTVKLDELDVMVD